MNVLQQTNLEIFPTKLQVYRAISLWLNQADIEMSMPYCVVSQQLNHGGFDDMSWDAERWGVTEELIIAFEGECSRKLLTLDDFCEMLTHNTTILDVDVLTKMDDKNRYSCIMDFIQAVLFRRAGKYFSPDTPVEKLPSKILYGILSLFVRSEIFSPNTYHVKFKVKSFSLGNSLRDRSLYTYAILIAIITLITSTLIYFNMFFTAIWIWMCFVLPFCLVCLYVRDLDIDTIKIDSCNTLEDITQLVNEKLK
jgi:hypothetical protein